MADHANSPALNTQIESGNFDEKHAQHEAAPPTQPKVEDADDEDEDIDALIEDLESQDGHGEDAEEEERDEHGGRLIPEELLQTVSQTNPPYDLHYKQTSANHPSPRRTPALV